MQKSPNFLLKYWHKYLFLLQLSLGQELVLFTSSIETGVKENVLAQQLFLDLIRFMLGWSLYLSIILEIVFSSRERVCLEKS